MNYKQLLWSKCKEVIDELTVDNFKVRDIMKKYDEISNEVINCYLDNLTVNHTRKLHIKECMKNYVKKYKNAFQSKLAHKGQLFEILSKKCLKITQKLEKYYNHKGDKLYEKYKDYYSYDIENEDGGYHDYDEMFARIESEELYEISSFCYNSNDDRSKVFNAMIKKFNNIQNIQNQYMFILKYTEYWRVGVDVIYERIKTLSDLKNKNVDDYVSFYLLCCPL